MGHFGSSYLFSIFWELGLSYLLYSPHYLMQFSYLLSFVDLSSCFLQFDRPEGRVLRCCSRSFRQLADPLENSRALDSYTTYLVDAFFEALRDQELERQILITFHTADPDSDDY